MANGTFKIKQSLNLEPQAGSVVTAEGDVAYNDSSKKLEIHDGTTADNVVQEAKAATLTNKSISGASNTLTAIPNSATTAVSTNTANTIALRDNSGNFSANVITAALIGNATTATLASTVTTNANLTGPITSSGNTTSIASQTGTGTTFVMSAGPTITGLTTLSGTGLIISPASHGSTFAALTLSTGGNTLNDTVEMYFNSSITQLGSIRAKTINISNGDSELSLWTYNPSIGTQAQLVLSGTGVTVPNTLSVTGTTSLGLSTSTSQIPATFDSNHANGTYTAWKQAGSVLGYIGNATAIIGGSPAGFAMYSVGDMHFSPNNSGVTALKLQSGQATITGALSVSTSLGVTGLGTFSSGLSLNGSPSGYGGEMQFNGALSGGTSAISTLSTGSAILYIDHRGTSNSGLFVWRNGTGAGTTLLTLGATGTLSITGNTTLSGAAGDRFLNIQTNTSGNPRIDLTAAGSDLASLLYDRTNARFALSISAVPTALTVSTTGVTTLHERLVVSNSANATTIRSGVTTNVSSSGTVSIPMPGATWCGTLILNAVRTGNGNFSTGGLHFTMKTSGGTGAVNASVSTITGSSGGQPYVVAIGSSAITVTNNDFFPSDIRWSYTTFAGG